MALERPFTAAPAGQFTCPMHPEVLQDEPGDCPICGMALEPVSISEVEADNSEPALLGEPRLHRAGLFHCDG
jgi:Cu+-exporting ATPase